MILKSATFARLAKFPLDAVSEERSLYRCSDFSNERRALLGNPPRRRLDGPICRRYGRLAVPLQEFEVRPVTARTQTAAMPAAAISSLVA